MTHLLGPALSRGRVDLQTWIDGIKPDPTFTNDTVVAARHRAWDEAEAFDPAWCTRNAFLLAHLLAGKQVAEIDLARIDLRPLDPPSEVAFTDLPDAQVLCEAEWQELQKDVGVMPIRPLSDLDILNAAIKDRFGTNMTAVEAAAAIRRDPGLTAHGSVAAAFEVLHTIAINDNCLASDRIRACQVLLAHRNELEAIHRAEHAEKALRSVGGTVAP